MLIKITYKTGMHPIQVDAKGHIIEYRYNIFGKVIQQIDYHQKMTDKELAVLLAGDKLERLPDRNIDRLQSTFYNADGHIIGEQDAKGYVTEYMLDAGGRRIEKICYANANPLISDDFQQIRPPENIKEDGHYYYVYNLLNQCIAAIDPKGHITTIEYDLDNKKKKIIEYANPINMKTYQCGTLPTITPDANKDVTTQFDYDVLRRRMMIRKSDGSIETTYYDEMNHETARYQQDLGKLDHFSGDDCKGTAKAYDAWEQEIAYANPFVASELMKASGNPALQKEIWRQYEERSTYDQTGLRTKHQDVYGHTTLFYYDKERRPVLTIDPMGAATQYTRNSFGEITEKHRYYQRLSDSTLSFLSSLNSGYISDATCQLLKKDDQDRITQLKRDKRGQVIRRTDPEGRITTFDYNAFKECSDEYLPTSTSTLLHIQHQYDQRGLEIKTVRENQGEVITVEKKYDHPLGMQTDIIDESGLHTHFVLDCLGNTEKIQKKLVDQLITTDTITRDFLGRPTKKINAENQVTTIEYDQNKRDTIIRHESTNAQIVSTANIFDEPIQVVKTAMDDRRILHQQSFEHAPNGEVIIEQDGVGNVKQIDLDLMGYKKAKWNANQIKTQYAYNAAYQLTEKIVDAVDGGLNLKTTYTPNVFGDTEKVVDPKGIVTTHEFNRCGQVLLTTQDAGKNGLNITQQKIYDQAGNEVDHIEGDTTTPKQYHERKLVDGFNREIATVIDPENLAIWHNVAFDHSGHIIKEMDPLGYATYHYYDEWNRQCFTVSAINENEYNCTAYQYNTLNQLTGSRLYQSLAKKELITDALTHTDIAAIFKTTPNDTVSLFYYDGQGRERFHIRLLHDPKTNKQAGLVSEKRYDAAGHMMTTIDYAQSLMQEGKQSWTTEILEKIVTTDALDCRLHYWYDTASRERLCINQDGYVTEKRYDSLGNVIADIQYHDKMAIPSSQESLDSVLSQIHPNPKNDKITHYAYQAVNKLAYTVYPNGLAERRDYDQNGNLTQICQFAEKMNNRDDYSAIMATLASRVPDQTKDRITAYTHDNNNQIATITDALGHVDTFTRNALGQIKTHTDRAGAIWQEEVDAAKRLTAKISPETRLTRTKREENKLTYETYAASTTEKMTHDKAGNVTTLTMSDGKGNERVMHSQYDANRHVIATQVEAMIDEPAYQAYIEHPDLSVLPVKKAMVETRILYNAKNKKIAEQDENGHWSYHFYDSVGRLVLSILKEQAVIEYKHNAFGEVIKELHYAQPIKLDFTHYQPTGYLDETILNALETSPDDRVTTKTYNGKGLIENIQSGPVFYYAQGDFGIAQPETKKSYNTFGDRIYEANLISPGVWAEKWFQYDEVSRLVAEINEDKYLTRYQRDAAGNIKSRTEYANPLLGHLHPDEEMTSIVEVDKSPKDQYC